MTDKVAQRGKMFSDNNPVIDKIKRIGGLSSITSANSTNLYGFNHRKMPLSTARNSDHQGFTFFTRPDLRLSYDNITKDRMFSLMNTKEPESVWRWVRATLDPRLSRAMYPCPFVDQNNPFIPLLSNNLKSMSGWSEITVDPYTSDSGYYNEQYSQADGFAYDYSSREITATFKNQIQDPINRLFSVWTRYSMLVHEGVIDPHLTNLVMNIVDYNTRIYRFVMDSTKQYVQHVSACGAAFPLNSQLASKFDFSDEKPYNEENDTVSIQFKTIGMMYDDPILLFEFNKLVEAYNPYIHPKRRGNKYIAVPPEYTRAFNMLGLPYIDLTTGKLEWFVTKEEYKVIMNIIGDVYNEQFNLE